MYSTKECNARHFVVPSVELLTPPIFNHQKLYSITEKMYVDGGKITFSRYMYYKKKWGTWYKSERPAVSSSFETILSPYVRLKLAFYDIL